MPTISIGRQPRTNTTDSRAHDPTTTASHNDNNTTCGQVRWTPIIDSIDGNHRGNRGIATKVSKIMKKKKKNDCSY